MSDRDPTPEQVFPHDYRDARSRFLRASRDHNGTLEEVMNPVNAPDGNPVFTDLAWHGPREADRVLVTISGTHGTEGYPGTAAQLAWLQTGKLPEDVALLQIHALNPYGYAWTRRVTEGNVDLNRNFVDHDQPHPKNPGYEELFPEICPRDWTEETIQRGDAAMERFMEAHGTHVLQKAISGGQYQHPDGIFYGGTAPVWSRRTLETAIDGALAKARRVAVVDLHTGLGPYGHGERIVMHDPKGSAYRNVQAAFGDDFACPTLGNSVATELPGTALEAIERRLPGRDLVACALEFGSEPTPEVRRALRADNWLHLHAPDGTLESETGQRIKAELSRVFVPEDTDWRHAVLRRSLETFEAACAWLQRD
ncbi:M14 family metallopeptidase [Rhodovibrio salinarum]|uniref:DUF2817 domain-containing protein n=1 Tax=Rhodovibrio salinarum TaxID=1087 RepID=A0A934QHT3_9PROT|nr:M14 family metallopeptidase [Rhodovibrio salinarum]MBK1697283.1 DUF2817 domain-containing protein [Rhodovibrio salinarum]